MGQIYPSRFGITRGRQIKFGPPNVRSLGVDMRDLDSGSLLSKGASARVTVIIARGDSRSPLALRDGGF